jgi:phage tail-like protein
MPAQDHDAAFQGSFFAFEVDNIQLAWFTGVSGLSLEFEVAKFKEGNGTKVIERKRPGRPKYSEVVLKRGFTPSKQLYDWFKQVTDSASITPYKTASIVLYTRAQSEAARFNLENAWPSKLSVSDLSADSDETMIEELTIQHELLDWV